MQKASKSYKVRDKLICKCDDRHGVALDEVVTIIEESNGYITYRSSKGEWCWDSTGAWPNDFELYKENTVELNKANKYFINVVKYAENNGISIQQASEEIQRWLFKQGFCWYAHGCNVTGTIYKFLCLNSNNPGEISYTDTIIQPYKEIKLLRKETVELSMQIEEETVEFNGKRYSKSKLEQALKLIDESN